ncbi:MAG: DNA polymerase II large subunit [Thermoplasmata archaeon]
MQAYFARIESAVGRAYDAAEKARRQGLDPELTPEIPRAQDMAMRVEKLLGHLHLDGISTEIRDLSKTMSREDVALTMARRLASDASREDGLEARIDRALRVGLAILTEGILVAPLEGLAEVHLRESRAGTPYVELYYAGPIRAAGGTAQALSVLLADLVRRDLGLSEYRPDPDEIGRYQEEIPLYKHLQHLQYVPSALEIEAVARNVPVCISGEATEGDAEVSAFRNLPRVTTNGIRGGMCLVIAEGLCQKSEKIRKIVERLGVPGWEFLQQLGRHKSLDAEASASPKYLAEALGGRPILGYPHRPGGFRLTYGRARTSGLAACAINPATMVILRRFVAVGTQIKLEFPGKAAAMGLCDTIEGPIVELTDGTVTAVHDLRHAEAILPEVSRIIDLGALLVPFGEFLENNRPLAPAAYTLDWHLEEARARGVPEGPQLLAPTWAEALAVARENGIPLHPRYLLFWHDLTTSELGELSGFVERHGSWTEETLHLPWDDPERERIVRLGVLHARGTTGNLVVDPGLAPAFLAGLGLALERGAIARRSPVEPLGDDPIALVSRWSGVEVRARAPTRVGARVGRPEKARQRKMSPNVHVLFPLGDAGGAQRSVAEAARRTLAQGVKVPLGRRVCPACGKGTVWLRCPCGTHTEATGDVVNELLPVAPIWAEATSRLHLRKVPEVKGVKGLTSPGKVPEILEKGILRASHGISVYQDGTARFDLTDLPLTHVRPREIGLSIEAAHALGYAMDWTGAPLTEGDQLVELRPQDIIVSRSCGTYLLHLAQFVDDELVRLYATDAFYRAGRPEDLIGAIVVALAPHTSGGVAGRIVGFTEAEACFAHPVFHAAKRRNCDGDEDSVTLLMDALLNFSRAYLPQSRGALMDKPLVLTTRLDPTEVDKEAHNVDLVTRYPLALYRAAALGKSPKEVEPLIETMARRLARDDPFRGAGFTHDTTDIAGGPVYSAYREAGSMGRIVEQALTLTVQLRSVDVADAVTLVLNSHFLPDLMGNMKSFATQKFRCKVCGESYRRPPLTGRCSAASARATPCGGDLLPTVYEGAVKKYLGLSQRLAATPGVTDYLRQRIQLLESSLATLFPGALAQTTLETYGPAAPSVTAPPT